MVSKEIIYHCLHGNRLAYRQLYDTCAPFVFTIVKQYITDKSYRKDAMQEVFAEVFLSLKNYDESKGAFKSWLSRIAVNRCITLYKRTINFNIRLEVSPNEEIVENTFAYLDQLTRAEIEAFLTKMPKGYRCIFLLSVIDSYSHKEIGVLLGITPETSRSQLSRAINWIKKNILSHSKDIIYGTL